MDDLQVQRYSAEVKIYIAATAVLAVLIVGLVWWNASKDAQRQAELEGFYTAYQELGRHIKGNVKIDDIKVCTAIEKPPAISAEGTDLSTEQIATLESEYNKKLVVQRKQIDDFTKSMSKQYTYLSQNRPSQTNPELMNDALLFRLNKTFNSFTASLQRLGERCGDLTEDQVNMRKRRFSKSLARFNANLKNLEASNR